MNHTIVTIDLDWACEPAIEETLITLENFKIIPTVFNTHHSPIIATTLYKIDVGLHPYFGIGSSHGKSITDVVKYVMDLPHNIAAFRCHRFAGCNIAKQAMIEAGMLISSNVCTDLEIISPFRERCGLLEIPIFLEDGGYLWRGHMMSLNDNLRKMIACQGLKVISIHPMHFAANSPTFSYMYDIKQSMDRKKWQNMTTSNLHKLRWRHYGIRNLIMEVLTMASTVSPFSTLRKLIPTG